MKQQKIRRPLQITKDTFVISDLHFGHNNVEEFEPSRTAATLLDGLVTQEEMLIARWNAVIKPYDHVIVLGDYAFKMIKECTEKLNGQKELIIGNHDKPRDHAYYDAGFEFVYREVYDFTSDNLWSTRVDDPYISGAICDIGGHRIFLDHYPIDYYEDCYTDRHGVDLTMRVAKLTRIAAEAGCTINICGHTHSVDVPESGNGIAYLNVSCEKLDFTPIKLGELLDAAGI